MGDDGLWIRQARGPPTTATGFLMSCTTQRQIMAVQPWAAAREADRPGKQQSCDGLPNLRLRLPPRLTAFAIVGGKIVFRRSRQQQNLLCRSQKNPGREREREC
jgi:hypothetical protein